MSSVYTANIYKLFHTNMMTKWLLLQKPCIVTNSKKAEVSE